ncbi:MAG: lipase family protein [Rickettsiaceae bacterium]|nr:lipase family protein [Rickettsiaceae bacterium]
MPEQHDLESSNSSEKSLVTTVNKSLCDALLTSIVASELSYIYDSKSPKFQQKQEELKQALNLQDGENIEVRQFFKDPARSSDIDPAGCVIIIKDESGKPKEAIVSYHGTNSARDALIDGRALRTSAPELGEGAQVHSGFYNNFQASKDNMYQIFKDININNPDLGTIPVKFVGHSLGGAVTQIAALDASKNHKDLLEVSSVQTVGGPKVFSRATAQNYNETLGSVTTRLQNKQDPVPKVPPESMGYGSAGPKVMVDLSKDPHSTLTYRDGVAGIVKSIEQGGKIARAPSKHLIAEEMRQALVNKSSLGIRRSSGLSFMGFKNSNSTQSR